MGRVGARGMCKAMQTAYSPRSMHYRLLSFVIQRDTGEAGCVSTVCVSRRAHLASTARFKHNHPRVATWSFLSPRYALITLEIHRVYFQTLRRQILTHSPHHPVGKDSLKLLQHRCPEIQPAKSDGISESLRVS